MPLISLLLFIFTFVELNCENFFDIYDNPAKDDDAYTPRGSSMWTKKKYYHKLNSIGKELIACGEDPETGKYCLPDIVALCEVESDTVMTHLARRSPLRRLSYDYLMTDSPDPRGINVALLYNTNSFRPLDTRSIAVKLPYKGGTRDILYAKGLIVSLDTLHVFVVHSPSRLKGTDSKSSGRMNVATTIAHAIDSIRGSQASMSRHHIIVAGDFNDYSGDPPLLHLKQNGLTEVSKGAKGMFGSQVKGTYYYGGEWGSLDHILVSESLAARLVSCKINDNEKFLETNSKGVAVPKRAFKGSNYCYGFSDHLPLVARFELDLG